MVVIRSDEGDIEKMDLKWGDELVLGSLSGELVVHGLVDRRAP